MAQIFLCFHHLLVMIVKKCSFSISAINYSPIQYSVFCQHLDLGDLYMKGKVDWFKRLVVKKVWGMKSGAEVKKILRV